MLTKREIHHPTLYRKNQKGNIGYWEIYTINNVIHTSYGTIGGAEQTSDKAITRWTNEGKVNERSPLQQAEFEAKALWQKRRDNGYYENINEARDEERKTSISGGLKPMKAYPFITPGGVSYEHKIKYPCYMQPKYNGVRATSSYIDNKITLWSSGGKEYQSCRHIKDQLQAIVPIDMKPDGEIYKPGVPLQEISGWVRRVNCHSMEDQVLNYYIFDTIDFTLRFRERLTAVNSLNVCNQPNIFLAPTILVENKEQGDQVYEEWISQGYEGAIYRNLDLKYTQSRSINMIKRKKWQDDEFKIVGAFEGEGELEGKLGSWLCSKNGKEFKISMNGPHEYLEELWINSFNFIGKMLTVRFLELSKEGIPTSARGIHIRPEGE